MSLYPRHLLMFISVLFTGLSAHVSCWCLFLFCSQVSLPMSPADVYFCPVHRSLYPRHLLMFISVLFKGFSTNVTCWCLFLFCSQVSLPMSPADTSGQQVKPVPLIDTWWRRQTPVIVRRDFLMDFIITVVFPLGLGLLLFFILSYVMFGRREGV